MAESEDIVDELITELQRRAAQYRLEALRDRNIDPILCAQWFGSNAGLNEAIVVVRRLMGAKK